MKRLPLYLALVFLILLANSCQQIERQPTNIALLLNAPDSIPIFNPFKYQNLDSIENDFEWIERSQEHSSLISFKTPFVYHGEEIMLEIKKGNDMIMEKALIFRIVVLLNFNNEVFLGMNQIPLDSFQFEFEKLFRKELREVQNNEKIRFHLKYCLSSNFKIQHKIISDYLDVYLKFIEGQSMKHYGKPLKDLDKIEIESLKIKNSYCIQLSIGDIFKRIWEDPPMPPLPPNLRF
jgi:UDP-galactopyranose mutase